MNFEKQSTLENSNIKIPIGIFTLIFTFLFYRSGPGLNMAILILLLLSYWAKTKKNFTSRPVIILSISTLVTALTIAWYGTADTILWGILSLTLLSQQLYYPQSSILLTETKTFVNFFVAPLRGITALLDHNSGKKGSFKTTRIFHFLVLGALPFAFAFFFATIYKNLNPFFENLYKEFIDSIDFQLVFTILLGLIIAFILLRPFIPEQLLWLEQFFADDFRKGFTSEGSENTRLERKVGIVLFAMLNSILFAFLGSDVFFLNELSKGGLDNYSVYVHQGVGLLIFSIIIASSFILYFFRGAIASGLPGRDWLKILAVAWMILNIGIVMTTAGKNLLYVFAYSLTLKRVGVFVYLLLTIAGLFIALLKIFLRKTNAFLFRQLYWAFFSILTLNICIDWSTLITRFNLNRHIENSQALDWNYLLSLDERVLPTIAAKRNNIRFTETEEEQLFAEKLNYKLDQLKHYEPGWRQVSFAGLYSRSKIQANKY